MIRQIGQIIIAPILFAVLWLNISPFYHLPPLTEVYTAIIEMIKQQTYVHDILVTSLRAIVGFTIGFSGGMLWGMLTGRNKHVHLLSGGLLHFLRLIPILAILPLTIRIGGLGEYPKIFLISWTCFFVSWITIHNAAKNIDERYTLWAKSMNLTWRQTWWYVYLPYIAPTCIGVMRSTFAISFYVVVAAELSGTYTTGFFREGLGYRIARSIETGRDAINVACILTFGFLGIFYDQLIVLLTKKILPSVTGINYYLHET